MKQLIVFLILVSQMLLAQELTPAAKQFNEATILYNTGNYEKAAKIYENIVSENNEIAADLFYNLGNCYYQLNKVAPAIYNYEKALLIQPNFDKASINLAFAQKKIVNKIAEAKKTGAQNLYTQLLFKFHYDTWALLAIFFGFGCTATFIFYYFLNKSVLKRLFFALLIFSGICCILTITLGFAQKQQLASHQPAIVFSNTTEGKEFPRSNSETVQTLHEGTKVFILETKGNWQHVELTDNRKVWIAKESVIEVR